MNSKSTTVAGMISIAQILVAFLIIGTALYHWDGATATLPRDTIMWALGIFATGTATGGVGLMLARDNNKSSEDVGIK